MKKLPRVLSTAKDVGQVAKDLNQVQSGAFPVLEAALKQVISVTSITSDTAGAVLVGYAQVETPFGTFWLPMYSAPT